MANKNEDKDIFGLASDSSLEKQRELAEQLVDQFARHMESTYSSVFKRLSAAQEKSLSPMQKAIYRLQQNQREYERNAMSMGDRFRVNMIDQFGSGGKFDPNTANEKLLKSLGNLLDTALSTYVTSPIQKGFTQMANAFESNFTEIAGRAGTNRQETYSLMREAVSTLNNSPYKGAISANADLIPAIKAATQQGFNEERAAEVGLSNAIDSKLMPWLDTASDTWANLVANLDSSSIKQMKAQQLQLQATETGNRLLQSGVINSLTSELAPILTNIDFNTGGAQNLAPEAMAYMEQLMKQGFTASEAYAEASSVLRDWKDPIAALDRGDYQGVMRFSNYYSGDDSFQGMATAGMAGLDLAVGAGRNYGFVANNLGVGSQRGINRAEEGARIYEALASVDWDKLKGASPEEYEAMTSQITEKVTKTYQWDTAIENGISDLTYGLNNVTHGTDMLSGISKGVWSIFGWLTAKATFQIGSGILKSKGLIPKGAASSSDDVGSLISRLTGKGSKSSSIKPKNLGDAQYLDYMNSMDEADDIAKSVTRSTEKLKKLGKFGGKALGVGGVLLGAGQTAASFAEGNTAKGVVNGAATIASGAGMAFPPALIAALGIDILGNHFVDLAQQVTGVASELEESRNSIKESVEAETTSRKEEVASISQAVMKTENIEEAQKLVKESGIASEKELQGKSKEQILELITTYSEAQDKLKGKIDEFNEGTGKEITKEQQNDQLEMGWAMADKGADMIRDYLGIEGHSKDDEELLNQLITFYTSSGLNYEEAKGAASSLISGTSRKRGRTVVNTDKAHSIFANSTSLNIDAANASSEFYGLGKTILDVSSADTEALVNAMNIVEQARTLSGEEKTNKLNTAVNIYKDLPTPLRTSDEGKELVSTINSYAGKELVQAYAVGSDYIYSDRLALLHKGEAVVRASENKNNLQSLLDLNQDQMAQRSADNNEIVNAIHSQTAEIKILLENILTALSKQPRGRENSLFNNSHNNITSMIPEVANSRIVAY